MGGCFTAPREDDQPPEQPQSQHGEFVNWPFTNFFLSDLTTATKNFSSEEVISESAEESTNVVYKGRLSESLGFVAVKRFNKKPWDKPDYFTDDAKEVGNLKHKRLVKLLGYCCEEDEGLLVAEYMPNDTLAKRLFHQKNLDWAMRLRVAYHIAEALEYCTTANSYCYDNLSANSVLFDKDDDACLSSFGLVKEIIRYNRREGGIVGVSNGNVTYRFGTILMNLLTGIQIAPKHAREMIKGKDVTELMDPNLKGKYSKEEATILLKLASECLKCWDGKIVITKEVVARFEAMQVKTDRPSLEMLELAKQKDVASSSQQQQAQEVPSSEMPGYQSLAHLLQTGDASSL